MSGIAIRRCRVAEVALATAVLWVAGISTADEPSPTAKALAESMSVAFEDQPLSNVIDFIKEEYGINIQIDNDVLTDGGVGTGKTVNRKVFGVAVGQGLKSILADLGLDYIVDDEIVMITTVETARALSDRALAFAPHAGLMEAKIEEALTERTELDFTDQPLSDVVDYLKNRHEIEIQFDNKALADAGVSHDTTVTRNLKGITLQSALNIILGDLDLDYAIRNEVLLITSKSALRIMRELRVYPVQDLVGSAGEEGEDEESDEHLSPEYDPLLAAVRTALGEEAEICAYPVTGSLIVKASLAGQREVQRLFELLRQVRQEQARHAHATD